MNRVFNWVFGSFFRTLGRILVYILIGYLLFNIIDINSIKLPNLFGFLDVNADTKKLPDNDSVYELTINNTTYDGKNYQNSNIDKNTSTTLNLGLVARSGSFISFPFFALDICATDNIIVNRTYSSGQACTNSCFSNQVSTIKTSFTCSTSNTPGNIYRVKIPIAKFTIGSSGTSLNTIDDTITISTKSNYVVASNIMSAYITDEFNEQIDYSSTIDNSTNTIIDNQNQNNQQIIDNQNNLLGSTCQNLVDLSSFTSRTINGITFTNNNDGSITINGTATANFGITFSNFVIESGTYTANSSSFNYYLYDYNSLTSILNQGETKSFGSTYNNLGVDSYINSGQTFNNILFKPMITKSSTSLPYCKYGSINSKLDDVSSSINDKSQEIINNQNSNTDREIESQKVCETKLIDKSYLKEFDAYLYPNGAIITDEYALNWGITDYIQVDEVKVLSLFGNLASACFYNDNKQLLSCVKHGDLSIGNISLPDNTKYARFSINYIQNKPTFEVSVCKNGNQALGDGLNDINNSLTDDSPPTNLDSLSNSAGWLPAGPVDSILNLPFSFLTNLNTNLSKSCQPVNLPLPYINKNLPLPCVNSLYNEIDGLPNWINIVGTIASAFILFSYFINLYKYVDDTLTFRENNYIDNWSGV